MTMLVSLLVWIVMLPAAQPPVTTLANDVMSHVEEARQVVVRTQGEWASLWREHAGDKPAPVVNFDTTMVVAVFLGTRPTAGFGVEIAGVRHEGGALLVEWSEQRPDRARMVAQVITTPARLVAVPRFTGEVRFEKLER